VIQGLLVGVQVGRTWLRPGWHRARALLPARWAGAGAQGPVAVAPMDPPDFLRRLQEQTDAIVERALARSIESSGLTADGRPTRLRMAMVAHIAGTGWRVCVRADEARTLAAAAPLREIDARFIEAMARSRDVGRAPSAPAFERRLALLEVMSDAAHPGLRSEHELGALRRARVAEEVAQRTVAFDRIARIERQLSSQAQEAAHGAHLVAEAGRLLRNQWRRLASAPLSSGELDQGAEELAGAYAAHLALAQQSPTRIDWAASGHCPGSRDAVQRV
jgi:hypothetical protein